MPPVTYTLFLKVLTVCISALSTQNFSKHLPKTLPHHLTSTYLQTLEDLLQSRVPSPVNQLRRRLLFPKLRRFSFASTNQSPRWVGGQNCVGQWERPIKKPTNEKARGQKTEYTEGSRQEACMKPMCGLNQTKLLGWTVLNFS